MFLGSKTSELGGGGGGGGCPQVQQIFKNSGKIGLNKLNNALYLVI